MQLLGTMKRAGCLDELEAAMIGPRAAVSAAVIAMAWVLPSPSPVAVTAVGLWLALVCVFSLSACYDRTDSQGLTNPQRRSYAALGADVMAAAVLALVLGASPSSPALLLLPLLGLEIAFKTGPKGALAAAAGFGAALAVRVGARTLVFGVEPRYGFIALLAGACAAFLAAGVGLHAKDLARSGALSERDRIASLLRATLMELHSRAGRNPDSFETTGLSSLLEEACRSPEAAPEVSRVLLEALSGATGPAALSPRETEVLAMVGAKMSDREIAEALFLSPGTIRVHVSNALKKLGVSRRSEALEILGRLPHRPEAAPEGSQADRHFG